MIFGVSVKITGNINYLGVKFLFFIIIAGIAG